MMGGLKGDCLAGVRIMTDKTMKPMTKAMTAQAMNIPVQLRSDPEVATSSCKSEGLLLLREP